MNIDIYHDTACPFCRIGKRHLELALAQWQGPPVTVNYRAFFLNPAIPPEGYEFRTYMTAKGGGRVPLEQFFDAPRRMGAAVGLTFNFEDITRAPNTTLSHRLIAVASDELRPAVVDAIYRAYFQDGRDIGDLDVLVELAAGCGMAADSARALLLSDAGLEQVQAEARWAGEAGISGVPFFIFNGRYALSGAQPPDTFGQVLRRLTQETPIPAGE